MRAIICPNPKCHKKIEKPFFLNNFSTIPAEHYYACPHCFTKLNEYGCTYTNLAGLYLTAFGLVILAGVGYLTWCDMTVGGKNIALTGSRIGEAISQISIGQFILILFAGILSFIIAYGAFGIRATKRL